MKTIQQELKEVQVKINQLEFELSVEKKVFERLRSMDAENRSFPGGDRPPKGTGSIAGHIEPAPSAPDNPTGVSELVAALETALEERGVTIRSQGGLKPLIAGAIARRRDLFDRPW